MDEPRPLRKARVRTSRVHRSGAQDRAPTERSKCPSVEHPLPSSPNGVSTRTGPAKHVCVSCGASIRDRFVLKVGTETWHARCLACAACGVPLENHGTCYVRDNTAYCKLDYYRRFGAQCAKCERNIQASDWVRRARGKLYHLACFACAACQRQLSTGEEFGLLRERLLCRTHYHSTLERLGRGSENGGIMGDSNLGDPHEGSSKPAKRARTSFTAEQLQVMQAQFAQDNNPDAQTLQKLADITGLSRRVIQVWFQNCRARHKKHVAPAPALAALSTGRLSIGSDETASFGTCLCPESALVAGVHAYLHSTSPGPLIQVQSQLYLGTHPGVPRQ